jgi:hypothetical protein
MASHHVERGGEKRLARKNATQLEMVPWLRAELMVPMMVLACNDYIGVIGSMIHRHPV